MDHCDVGLDGPTGIMFSTSPTTCETTDCVCFVHVYLHVCALKISENPVGKFSWCGDTTGDFESRVTTSLRLDLKKSQINASTPVMIQ